MFHVEVVYTRIQLMGVSLGLYSETLGTGRGVGGGRKGDESLVSKDLGACLSQVSLLETCVHADGEED